jgi:hypothetical protein
MFRSKRAASLVLICVAVAAFGCGNSSTSPEPVTTAPVGPPTDVMARQYGQGDILVAWVPNSQANIVGVNLYRAEFGSDNFTKLNVNPMTAKLFLDDAVQYGVGYVYRVKSVNQSGNESVGRSVGIFNKHPKEPGIYPPPGDDKDISF